MVIVQFVLRVSIALLALYAMWDSAQAWSKDFLVPFTSHANLLAAIVLLWTATSLVSRLAAPPAWLEGAAVVYLTITAVVYMQLIGYPPDRPPTSVLGLTNTEILHGLVPAAFAVMWLVWSAHGRLKWSWALWWLSYLFVYLGIMLVRAQVSPDAGYPYEFIDLNALGASAMMRNVLVFIVMFAAIGLLLVWSDRRLAELQLRWELGQRSFGSVTGALVTRVTSDKGPSRDRELATAPSS